MLGTIHDGKHLSNKTAKNLNWSWLRICFLSNGNTQSCEFKFVLDTFRRHVVHCNGGGRQKNGWILLIRIEISLAANIKINKRN